MSKKATKRIFIDNERTRVTKWNFKPGAETGWHRHEYDYVVVPMLDGQLRLETETDQETISRLKKGVSYFREAGVEHNVININEFEFSFVEVEFK